MWFIIALASLLILIVLTLCVPLEIIFRVDTEGRPKLILKLVWLFGLFSRDLRAGQTKSSENRKTDKPNSNWSHRARFALEILQTRGLLNRLGHFVVRIYRNMKVKELAADLKVDLDNSADTGLLFAFIAPANLLANYFLRHPINIQPSFAGESLLTGYVNASMELTPIQVLASATGLVFSAPFFRAIKKMVVYRWKSKRL